MAEMTDRQDLVLVTGATGYVGGRLAQALTAQGRKIRCLVRSPRRLSVPPSPTVEVIEGDVLDPGALRRALRGVGVAYYLVHSMASPGRFEETDRRAAASFAAAARDTGMRRIIYLGGLGRDERLSPHLASRREVGHILRASGVPTIEFRCSVIIGAGSLSFEMVRALAEKLPVMVTPRWVRALTQPIAIDDVIAFLLAGAELETEQSEVFEIGGADRVSYLDLIKEYCRQRGLRRMLVPVPVLTPWLSSLWLGLVTPLQAQVGRSLIEGVRNDTVVTDPRALEVSDVRPRGIAEGIANALADEDRHFSEMGWASVLGPADKGAPC